MYRGLQGHKPLPKSFLQYVQTSFKKSALGQKVCQGALPQISHLSAGWLMTFPNLNLTQDSKSLEGNGLWSHLVEQLDVIGSHRLGFFPHCSYALVDLADIWMGDLTWCDLVMRTILLRVHVGIKCRKNTSFFQNASRICLVFLLLSKRPLLLDQVLCRLHDLSWETQLGT